MRDIKLYIASQLVDIDDGSVFLFTYTAEDAANPTIVKNTYTKAVTLKSTPRNDAIFGGIYNFTRTTIADAVKMSGVNFSTIKRTPFELYMDGDLVESGYMQLNSISRKDGVLTYKITLFGGIGDFFYQLSFNADGTKRTLADLNFNIDNAESPETEMDFIINKDAVIESWDALGDDRASLQETITFIPAYNGVAEDFDSEHALYNDSARALPAIPSEYETESDYYSQFKGFGLLEFPSPLDEWEVRDLRSYLQRPALKMSMLIRAIRNPENNGGYTVNLDEGFFNEDNPLYRDAYITLPMLHSDEAETDETILIDDYNSRVIEDGFGVFNSVFTGVQDVSAAPVNAIVRLIVPFSLTIEAPDVDTDTLYISPEYTNAPQQYSAIIAQLAVFDPQSRDILSKSPAVMMSNSPMSDPLGWYRYDDLYASSSFTELRGKFVRQNGTDTFAYVDEAGNNTHILRTEFIKGSNELVRPMIGVQRAYKSNGLIMRQSEGALYPRDTYDTEASAIYAQVDTQINLDITGAQWEILTDHLPSVSSGQKITKRMLLATDATPADYLLSYTKLFGLRYIKDPRSKTITITASYYNTADVVDLTQRIDRAEIEITPNVYDKRYMRLALETPDTYLSRKYKTDNGVDYGQKRVDTGYAFNAETEELYKGNVYQQAIPCRAVSRLFYTFYDAQTGDPVPSVFAEQMRYTLFAGNDDGIDKHTEYLPSIINGWQIVPFSRTKGYDASPRMCYFDMSDNVRERADVSNNLVIFCGKQEITDSAGASIYYAITDDIPEMQLLNGKPCYIVSPNNEEYSDGGDVIAHFRSELPFFLSMRPLNGSVTDTFDFNPPKELYTEPIEYPESAGLYARFWQGRLADRLNADTRKVVCKVDLRGIRVDDALLRKFFYFDGRYWILNRVVDYDPATDRPTKCEFILVQNPINYR